MNKEKRVIISSRNEKREFRQGDTLLLTVNLTIPVVTGIPPAAMGRINGYYEFQVKAKMRYAERVLLPMARKHCRIARQDGYPMPAYELMMDYTVTLARDGHGGETPEEGKLSLYSDVMEYTGGAHPNTVRYADNFSLTTGFPLPPAVKNRKERRAVTAEITRQALAMQASGTYDFFDGLPANIRRYFQSSQINLTETGIRVFYQLYTIAPYSSGIISFDIRE